MAVPIYEYECTRCGHEFEAIQSFSDKPLKKCEKCGGPVHKKVSQSSFHLKGTGWYVTDYAAKNPGSKPPTKVGEAASEAKAETKTETKAETKAETKTETKAEAKAVSPAK